MHRKVRRTSFEVKLGAGFLATILAAATICVLALHGLNESIKLSHVVMSDYAQDLIVAGRLGVEEESQVAAARGFLITGDKMYLKKINISNENFFEDIALLRKNNFLESRTQLLSGLVATSISYNETLSRFIKTRLSGVRLKNLAGEFENQLQPKREVLQKSVNEFIGYSRAQLEYERRRFYDSNKSTFRLVFAISLIALAVAGALALVITKALSKLYLEAQNTAKMREEIVEMVAHDLKNPVAAVSLSIQLLFKIADAKVPISPDDLRRRAESIKRANARVDRLIHGLLDLTKIKTGTLSIEKSPASPDSILKDTLELFKDIAKERRITLEVQSGHLPFIQCDFERLVQVFSNLIGNALKFSVANQKIIFGARREADSVTFFVTDYGPGIPIGEQVHVFERYWQTGVNAKAGTGLGLAICKGIVTAHGGKIWLESKIGSSTTFHFSIPVEEKTVVASRRKPNPLTI